MPRVLIVDDNPATRATSSALLQLYGIETATAEDGHAAVSIATALRFDLILVDLHLPDTSGIAIVKTLKAQGIGAAIVVMTAFPELDSSFEAGRADADGYIDGPLIGDELIDLVRQAAERRLPVRRADRPCGPGHTRAEAIPALAVPECHEARADYRIGAVFQIIASEPEISIEALARRMDLSESRLRHLFTSSVGVPPSRFLRQYRLALFARLLTTTSDRIGILAGRLGLGNIGKLFRAHFDMSPHAYRVKFRHRPGAAGSSP